MTTTTPLLTGVCRHCDKPIRQILPYPNAPTPEWYHIDGSRAYRECTGLKAEPGQDKPAEQPLGRHAKEEP